MSSGVFISLCSTTINISAWAFIVYSCCKVFQYLRVENKQKEVPRFLYIYTNGVFGVDVPEKMKKNMKKLTILLFCVTICCSCSPIFVPIVKTYGYYPPSYSAKITTTIPSNAEYIGTIAIVPNDHPVIMGWDKNLLYQTLEKEAAKAGANYVYITNIESSNVDYWFNYEEGDGFSIRAELYR